MIQQTAERVRANIKRVIVGKDDIIDLVLIAVLSEGHVLLEDVPGTGKTTLAKAVAASLGCTFRRIQFTPDLLPGDVTGINYFNQKTQEFVFRAGPLLSQVLLADEVNRATPRTQSALLEAMQERQMTIDGATHPLPVRFSCWRRRTRSSSRGPSRCPRRSLTVSCCASLWAIRTSRRKTPCFCASARRPAGNPGARNHAQEILATWKRT